jgi:FlaA1/EpsC-like NDP-sugar epimerase
MNLNSLKDARSKNAFGHDVAMAAISLPLSLYLRLGEHFYSYDATLLTQSTILFTIVAGGAFWSMRLYGGVWRYASLHDLQAITRAVTLAILIFLPLLFLLTRLEAMPRSTLVINWFVLIGLLGGPRFVYRLFKDRRAERNIARETAPRVPVLLVGAGDAAELFIRATNRNPASAYHAVGLVDEKGSRIGRNIHGVHVLGDLNGIPLVVERLGRQGLRPQRLILTKEKIDGAEVRSLLECAESLGITLARLPRLTDFRNSVDDVHNIRPIAIEDLLGRPQTLLDRASMKTLVHGKRVLVTGAGGTIGSELSRQIARFDPARITMIDNSEYLLYEIDLELRENHPDVDRHAVLADVRDRGRINGLFAAEAPELVFHAAALKHVPVVESFPDEGVLTNAVGTRIVADACRANDVQTMVQISTDKAVNPSSLMGATKRIAETYCQALDITERGKPARTRFVTVRFGNVLGSTGSVVPLFQRQLANGGPLTVTHPDMKRFFMTVREAVELVLEASVLGSRDKGGEGKIYVLDMGEPVRIMDLARQMILLAGFEPERDIRIEITGPRPGEKLYEEVLHDSEPPRETEYGGILLAAPRIADEALLARELDELESLARDGKIEETVALIRRLVPEYQPPDHNTSREAANSQG